MGKGGGGKGGGGTPSAPKISIPPALNQDIGFTQNLGGLSSTMFSPLESMINWATDLATGGNVAGPTGWQSPVPQISSAVPRNFPPFSGGATSMGPPGSTLSMQPVSGVPGATGTPGVQAAEPTVTLNSGQPMSWDWVAHDAGLSSADVAAFMREGKTPQQVALQFGVGTSAASVPGAFMGSAINALNAETGIAGTTPTGLDPATLAARQKEFFGLASQDASKTAAQMPGGNLPASGLYPQQQALIDQQTKAAQSAITQQLASEGLSSSTQGAMLRGEIGQQGAATAGQLIQGNLNIAQNAQQLAQAWQQMGQNWARLGAGEQTLSLAEQEQSFNMFGQIAQQSQGMQQQMWSQALQGYGALGSFIQETLGAFGLSADIAGAILKADTQTAINQTELEKASMTQQASASQSMFGALGSLFGSGGGGSSLFGSLGSSLGGLFGGGAAAAGTVGAAAGTTSIAADFGVAAAVGLAGV